MDRTRIWPAVAAFMLLGIFVVAGQAEESQAAQAETGGCAVWSIAETQNTAGQANALVDVDVLDPGNVWAAGYWVDDSGNSHMLVQRYTGTRWELVPSQQIGTGSNYATGVAVAAPGDVWVTGSYRDVALNRYRAMILRCNTGSCTPTMIPSPGNSTTALHDITAVAPNDVWAAGDYFDTTSVTFKPLVMHYDGVEWTIVPVPTPSPVDVNHYLNSISASGPNDVWAVGSSFVGVRNHQYLALHWDGSTWTQVTSLPGLFDSRLHGVHAIAANDVWAVGWYKISTQRPMIFHWNGSAWTNESPATDPSSGELTDVTATSSGDVWVVGRLYEPGNPSRDNAVTLRYIGSSWELVPLPDVAGYKPFIHGISGEPGGQVWAVGFKRHIDSGVFSTLAIHYPNRFSDLHTTNTFYPYVNCLLERGIVSGYDDCTFRPNADVTRGQLSKIVAGAAGFNEPPGEQMFEDVPPGSTFYEWTNRLARRGHVGGYPCGGEGEPCGPESLPYFRPGANATRGQISKIVSEAAGYSEPHTTQYYADVPQGNSFYIWIMRLTNRGIMAGYPCGGPGEPCDENNRPYFRWANNATRGQTSKIVAQTFFPNCQPVP